MIRRRLSEIASVLVAFWPLIAAFVAVKTVQIVLYPDPYMISDTGEYLNSARTLETNPYKPIAYSLFLAAARPITPEPIGVAALQALLKLVSTLALGIVLQRWYDLPRRVVLAVCFAAALNPTALLFDHYLLSDSLFTSLTIAMIAAFLAYARNPRWLHFGFALAWALVAVAFRFVGAAYPPLIALGSLLYGKRHKWLQTATVATATGALLFGLAAKTRQDLGVFKLTTFDGWALHGPIGHLLERGPIDPREIDDEEARLAYEYIMSFPLEEFRNRHRGFFRWDPESPAKNLLNTFRPIERRPGSAMAKRDSTFLYHFVRMSQNPSTPAQRMFDAFRNKTNSQLPPYVMDYRHAFMLTNELLRKVNREFTRRHRLLYLTGFYRTSLRKAFFPNEPPIVRGEYTYRETSDYAVAEFWPDEQTASWAPRFGDAAAALKWSHPWFVTGVWLLALHALVFALLNRRQQAVPWRVFAPDPGTVLFGFAFACAVFVSYLHMMEIRYTTPILMFVLTSIPFFYSKSEILTAAGKRKSSQRLPDSVKGGP